MEELMRENMRLRCALTLVKVKYKHNIRYGTNNILNEDDVKEVLAVAGIPEKEIDVMEFGKE
jgi:hypothetical protein